MARQFLFAWFNKSLVEKCNLPIDFAITDTKKIKLDF